MTLASVQHRTFNDLIMYAADKNATMCADENRPLLKTVLQRSLWHKLQATFVNVPGSESKLEQVVS